MRSDLTDSRGGVRNFLMEAGGGGWGGVQTLVSLNFFQLGYYPLD